MAEKILHLETVEPLDLYGAKCSRLDILKRAFPKIQIVARGHDVKVLGDEQQIADFEDKFRQVVHFLDTFNRLSDDDLVQILNNQQQHQNDVPDDLIVFGNNGRAIRARSANQQRMVDAVAQSDMLFALGHAGSG